MMTAIFLPVLLGGAGIAIDLTNVVKTKAALQEATDTAALSAAAALANNGFTTEEATLLAPMLSIFELSALLLTLSATLG